MTNPGPPEDGWTTSQPVPPPLPDPPPPPGAVEFADLFSTGEITGPLGRRSHRAPREVNPALRRLAPPVSAVAVVVVVILLLIWINGKPAGKGPGAGVVTAPIPTAAPIPSAAPIPTAPVKAASTPTPTAHPTSHPTSAQPNSAQPNSAQPNSAQPTATKTVRIGAGVPRNLTAMAPVVVLNNSTISGLAARVASALHAQGWRIKSVGNQQRVIPETTLYFAPGQRAAALHLAKEFAKIRRVHSAASAGITSYGNNLTLVVTRDWS